MVHEENPPSESSAPPGEPASLVDAILVPKAGSEAKQKTELDGSSGVVTAQLVDERASEPITNLPQENFSVKGGAVASTVLGMWSIAGSFISPYSIINALLGLALGFWGLSANVRWPWLGLVLSLFGVATCALLAAT